MKIGTRTVYLQGSEDIKNGSGYCRMMSSSQEYFEGALNNFQIYEGVLVLENGDYYCGSFMNYLPNGYMQLTCANGDSFQGFMKLGEKQGKGRITWNDGSYYYGSFVGDLKHGDGIYQYPNRDIFRGSFKEDKKSGNGKFRAKN